MTYGELLKFLLPHGVYSEDAGSLHVKDLSVAAAALTAAEANADDLTEDEIYPDKTDELLHEWERVYGISPDTDIPWQARIDNLMASVRAVGGLTKGYFIGLAARLGYTVTIEEFEPFMAGWSEAGDTLYTDDAVYCWRVTVANSGIKSYFFEAGISGAGDELGWSSDTFLESLFNRLKPAHTMVEFVYQ